jgi:hypothetical protein
MRQRIPAHFRERSVDGKGQIELRIDERAVQIKDQNADFGKAGDEVPQWNEDSAVISWNLFQIQIPTDSTIESSPS